MPISFGRKKQGSGAENEQQPKDKPVSRRKMLRDAGSRISSVVQESTTGPAIDVLKSNEAFELPRSKGWLVLLLEGSAIGGLGERYKSDEAKGSLIKLISADHIQVVATASMLSNDFLAIIPTADTLERMSEFSLLTEAQYFWGVVFRDEEGALAENWVKPGTYQEAVEISKGNTSLDEQFPGVWKWAEDGGDGLPPREADIEDLESTEDETESAESDQELGETRAMDASEIEEADPDDPFSGAQASQEASEPVSDDEESARGPEGEEVDTETGELLDPEDADAVDYGSMDAEAEDGEGFEDPDDFDPDAYESEEGWDEEDAGEEAVADPGQQWTQANAGRDVSEAQVREMIVRRFLSDDLDLSVDLTPFEATYNVSGPVHLEVPAESSDWLTSQVAVMAMEANAELDKLHSDHIEDLRTRYVDAMSKDAESIINTVSADREGSVFKEMMVAATKDFEEDKRVSGPEVSRIREEITARFESEAEERGEAAKKAAIIQFKDRNNGSYKRELSEAGSEVDRRNEEKFAHNKARVLEMRSRQAGLLMEKASTVCFQELTEAHKANLEAQTELVHEWNKRISEFLDANRKDDVARAEALRESLALDNSLERVRAEHASEIEEMTARHAARQQELADKIRDDDAAAKAHVEDLNSNWEDKLRREREAVEDLQKSNASLRSAMDDQRESIEAQYKEQIRTLEMQRDAVTQNLEAGSRMAAMSSKMMALIILGLTLAGLLAGYLIGGVTSEASALVPVLEMGTSQLLEQGTGAPVGL